MDAYLFEWLNLLLRWAHVITAIAWIGASFYFVMLDNSLTRPDDAELRARGVDGELWAVHGGGFYHSNKYLVAPRWRPLPERLHWSYWESYSTWLTGFALFALMYLLNAGTFLVDRKVLDWSPTAAAFTALGLLFAFWLVYDAICRTLGQRRHGDLWVAVAVVAVVVFAAWLACQLFAGRAAFVLVGAMLATAMSANVYFWIIPGQRKVVAALRAGQEPDPAHGRRGKQRSVHNTYFTLPVIVAMLSHHYGWLHQGPYNWVVLVGLMLAGALIRHSFVARHRAHLQGRRAPWQHALAGVAVLVALAVWLAPPPADPAQRAAAAALPPVSPAQIHMVMEQHCLMCHNAANAQKNVALHTPQLLQQHAQAVYQQTAVLRQMPLHNATQMSEAERELVRRWFHGGAPVQ